MTVDVSCAFWQPVVDIGSPCPFQITIRCPDSVDISKVRFSALHFSYSDNRADTVITSADGVSSSLVDVGDGSSSVSAALTWRPGSCIIFQGGLTVALESEVQVGLCWDCAEYQVTSVKLFFAQRTWDIEIRFDCGDAVTWYTSKGTVVGRSDLPKSVQ